MKQSTSPSWRTIAFRHLLTSSSISSGTFFQAKDNKWQFNSNHTIQYGISSSILFCVILKFGKNLLSNDHCCRLYDHPSSVSLDHSRDVNISLRRTGVTLVGGTISVSITNKSIRYGGSQGEESSSLHHWCCCWQDWCIGEDWCWCWVEKFTWWIVEESSWGHKWIYKEVEKEMMVVAGERMV